MRVEVVKASISFGAHAVFTDLSATFLPGSVTALAGPSGSGKSSLLAAVAAHQPLSGGRIELHRSLGVVTPPTPGVAVWVPQGSNALARRTVLDNVLIGPLSAGRSRQMAEDLAVAALYQVGLIDRMREQARRLSGGELQRVALARAIASEKPLILADEPSANLDALNTARVADLLSCLVTSATVVVATHDPLLIAAADHTVELRRL